MVKHMDTFLVEQETFVGREKRLYLVMEVKSQSNTILVVIIKRANKLKKKINNVPKTITNNIYIYIVRKWRFFGAENQKRQKGQGSIFR